MSANNSNTRQQNQELNEYIKEYLKYSGLNSTIECFEAELKAKSVQGKLVGQKVGQTQKPEELPRLAILFKQDNFMTKRELNLEKEIKANNKKYQQV